MFDNAAAASGAVGGAGVGFCWLPRIEVLVLRSQLDLELWRGADPVADTALNIRARQLTSRRRRERYARRLDALADAPSPRPALTAAIRRRPDVRLQRGLVVQLARRLRSDRPVSARGMLRLQVLLGNGNGPLFRPREPDALRVALAHIKTELDGPAAQRAVETPRTNAVP